MEVVRDFIAVGDPGRGATPEGQSGVDGVDRALGLLREVGSTAAGDSALWGFRVASDFAGEVEELSRAVEYLQLVAAAAVDRTRKQSAAAAKNAGTGQGAGSQLDARGPTPRSAGVRETERGE